MGKKKDANNAQLSKAGYLLILFGVTAVGVWLRCAQLGMQQLGGDEWNAVQQAVQSSFSHIFTHYMFADNCIPLTVYYKALLETVGLGEYGIRSLPLISGIALLIAAPIMVRPHFDKRIVFLLLLFLSFSPFLIFHSRWARPYSTVALLSFIAVFSFHRWYTNGRRFWAICYLVCAVLSPYFNLLAAAAVFAPLLFAVVNTAFHGKSPCGTHHAEAPNLRQVAVLGLILLAGWSAWFMPAYGSIDVLIDKAGRGTYNMQTAVGILKIISGLGGTPLAVGFGLLSLTGLILSLHRNRHLSIYLLTIVAVHLVSLLVLNPRGAHGRLIFGRYFISSIPIFLLWAAVGLDGLAQAIDSRIRPRPDRHGLVSKTVLAAPLILMVAVNPVWRINRIPNNFTNHSDYQYDYSLESIRFYEEHSDLFPRFYQHLCEENDDAPIIEAPMLSMWALCSYHLYQRVHGRRVLIGHGYESMLTPRLVRHAGLDLANMVNLSRAESLGETGAGYIIVHKDLLGECRRIRGSRPDSEQFFDLVREACQDIDSALGGVSKDAAYDLNYLLKISIGKPCFDDQWITVYRLSPDHRLDAR